jgi:hypothetical protein
MLVMLNKAIAGVGEKDDIVDVDDEYGANLVDGQHADEVDDTEAVRVERPGPDADKAEWAAYADSKGIAYPKSAGAARIEQAVVDFEAEQAVAIGAREPE